MVRAPCREKMGLKKGTWSSEEDQILISFVQKYGHGNWRALPKQAGLLRCGKICRLRWINYLRPDVKRGKFTLEEEETIIKSHEILGNRWSAIAARLPWRTDNEIKNVWHTHLKKRLNKNSHNNHKSMTKTDFSAKQHPTWSSTNANYVTDQLEATTSTSSKPSSSDFSSVTETTSLGGEETSNNNNDDKVIVIKDEKYTENQFVESTDFPEIDESFWSDHALSVEISNATPSPYEFSCPFFSSNTNSVELDYDYGTNNLIGCDMDFWHGIFVEAGGSPMLPEF